MANYGVTNSTALAGNAQQAVAATYKTLIATGASSGAANPPVFSRLCRGKIYDILVGTNGTPADNFMEWDLARATISSTITLLGSISSVSSACALDMADPGFASFVFNNSSNETGVVVTGEVFYVGVNQRASYRWVAAPGSEFVWPAVSSGSGGNGFALRTRSGAYTGTATGNILFQEQ
jgi:hypothetical protein